MPYDPKSPLDEQVRFGLRPAKSEREGDRSWTLVLMVVPACAGSAKLRDELEGVEDGVFGFVGPSLSDADKGGNGRRLEGV